MLTRFEISGRVFEIDLDPAKLMGDELLLIDEILSPDWPQRWANMELGYRDILVLAYLAARRNGATQSFEEFSKTIAPLTVRQLPVDAVGPKVRERRQKPKSRPKGN